MTWEVSHVEVATTSPALTDIISVSRLGTLLKSFAMLLWLSWHTFPDSLRPPVPQKKKISAYPKWQCVHFVVTPCMHAHARPVSIPLFHTFSLMTTSPSDRGKNIIAANYSFVQAECKAAYTSILCFKRTKGELWIVQGCFIPLGQEVANCTS